jgi:4-hydroxybenzoate polyprenyltransferase
MENSVELKPAVYQGDLVNQADFIPRRGLAALFDYVFLVRPVLFFPVWTGFFAGFLEATTRKSGLLHFQPIWQILREATFWQAFLVLSLAMAFSFVVNQFTDIHSDRQNNKLFLIAHGIIPKRTAVLEAVGLVTAGLVFALQGPGWMLLLFGLTVLVAGFFYSLPPFAFKDRPIAGFVVNMAGAFLIFFFGWRVTDDQLGLALLHSAPYLLAVASVYLLTTVLDEPGDRVSGKITFAVRYGRRRTVQMAIWVEIACIVMAVVLQKYLVLIPAVLSLPLFIRLKRDFREEWVVPATRFPILFLSLAMAVWLPFYLLMMAGIYLLSRWYYRNRFGLHYPSLTKIAEGTR